MTTPNGAPPILHFKPGVQLTDPITVTLPAGEWVAFINWINSHDTDGINYLLYGMFIDQLTPQLYDKPSIKAVQTHADNMPKTLEDIIKSQFPGAFIPAAAINDEGLYPNGIRVTCLECQDSNVYGTLPFGSLFCGHNGARTGEIIGDDDDAS